MEDDRAAGRPGMEDNATSRPVLVDTHCHLDAPQFADEPSGALLARAAAVGVVRVVTIATEIASSRRAVAMSADHPAVWATVGVDPNDAADFDAAALAELAALAASPRVVAIGEIGLDYHWNRAPHAVQAQVFRAQLDLARETGLPVVIHNRDADADTAAILLAWAADLRRAEAWADRPVGVMHCYSGDLALAQELSAAGFLISLAGPVTFKNARATQAVATGLPETALVLETDAPYLAPAPFRGQRNEPAQVRRVAEFVAELRGTTLEAIAWATSANAARLFGWDAPSEAWLS